MPGVWFSAGRGARRRGPLLVLAARCAAVRVDGDGVVVVVIPAGPFAGLLGGLRRLAGLLSSWSAARRWPGTVQGVDAPDAAAGSVPLVPLVPMRPSGVAGQLEYRPRFSLTDEFQRALSDLLVAYGAVEDPENPQVICDWGANNADGPPFHTRGMVLLFADGPDAGDPGFVFYRRGPVGAPSAVHVVDADSARRWAGFAYRLWSQPAEISERLADLDGYLTMILEDPSLWQPFDPQIDT